MIDKIGEGIKRLTKFFCYAGTVGYEKKNYAKATNYAPAFPILIKEQYHICPNCGAYVWIYDGRCKRCQQLLDWSESQAP